ncbi:MAG: peptidoglycan/xylan/chitin deacetylase (PgdA/CDA1 family) [Crocinitomix sp.]|jgi:peptidoglycan/xylan/chitin deacetylase (PgdA/CDA1 family)
MGNVLILNYHDIIDEERGGVVNSNLKDKRTVNRKTLVKQLDLIQASGIPIVSLNEWNSGDLQQQFAIALTFSGGFKSAIEIVFPILKSRGLTATFFPTLSVVNSPGGLTWGDLNRLIEGRMTIGSQGISGQNLRRMSKSSCQLELELSKRIFENKTGKKLIFFAAPSGSYNRRLLQLAYNAGYEKLIANRSKINTNTKALLLHRFTLKSNTNIAALEKLIVKGLLSNSKAPFFATISSQLSPEFGIGLLNKIYIKG